MHLAVAILLLVVEAVSHGAVSPANVDSGANITTRQVPPESNNETLQSLLHCSSQLQETPKVTDKNICSTDSSCTSYGDCCFNATEATGSTDRKNVSCMPIADYGGAVHNVMMVTRCNSSWPEDDIKGGCEDSDVKNETFHRIPVTGATGYVYSNAFCALCNYDSDSWTFWIVATTGNNETYFELQDESLRRNLRYCNRTNNFIDTCDLSGNASKKIGSMCQLYLEPVREDRTDRVYKNVYCAICNQGNLTSLSCENVTEQNTNQSTHLKTKENAFTYQSVKNITVNGTGCAAWFDEKCYINDTTLRYKGNAPNSKATDDDSYTYTYQHYLIMVCIGLSLFFLLMKGVTYAIFGAARSFASRCNLCLSGTLFFTQLVYILASYLDVSDDVCVVSSVFQHFGFVATFAWTTVLSFDMWRNISSMRVAVRSDKTLVTYGAVAWGVPLLLIAVCCVLNWVTPWSSYSPAYGQYYCFFGKYRPYIAFFLVPMGVLLAVDMGLYVHIIIYVRRTKDLRKGKGSKSGNQPSDMALFFKLALIMGASWFLGLLNYVNSPVIQVLTSVLNGLQGVYLFFGFQDYKYYVTALRSGKKRDKQMRSSTNSNASASTDVASVSEVPYSTGSGKHHGVKISMNDLPQNK